MKILDETDSKTQEYLIKIGRIIVEVNHLETFIELVIWQAIAAKKNDLRGDEQTIGRRITNDLSFMQKCDLLRSLLVERMGENLVEDFTKKIYDKLKEICERRNVIAHAKWFIQYGSNKKDLETHIINFKKAYEKGKAFNMAKANRIVNISELDELLKSIDETIAILIHYGMDKIKF